MATDPVKRVENWNEKYNVERISAILTEKRAKMLEHATSAIVSLAAMESQVKQVCDLAGASIIQYPFYLSFGREMWSKLQKEMGGEAMAQEAAVLISKWVGRGLVQSVLETIRTGVFNVSAPVGP